MRACIYVEPCAGPRSGTSFGGVRVDPFEAAAEKAERVPNAGSVKRSESNE